MSKRDWIYWPVFVLCWPVLLLIAVLMGIMALGVVALDKVHTWLVSR